ncbi:hypothetical protein GCM10023082_64250 [Streptomyces tremellae]|uniref:Uncharacterized protein n=1 Tax=Streptomyces tremellae TaxID=1124239 RepID=A0ABP7GD97_9ACTN
MRAPGDGAVRRAHGGAPGAARPAARPCGDGFGAGVVAVPGGGRRDARAVAIRGPGTARLLGGDALTSLSPAVLKSSCLLALAGPDPTMDGVQVKKYTKRISDRIPDVRW